MALTSGTNQSGNWSLVIDTTTLAEGSQVFLYNATNNNSLYNDTTSVVETIDNTPPTVTLNHPTPNQWINHTSNIPFNFTAVDMLADTINCNVTNDGSTIVYPNTVTNNTPETFPATRAEGVHSWNVTCWDNAVSNVVGGNGNVNTSATNTYYVDVTPPSITLNGPVDGYNTTSINNWFNFTAADNMAAYATIGCTLQIDGVANATNASVANNTPTLIAGTGMTEGVHSWGIVCVDAAGNSNFEGPRIIRVDRTPPVISFTTPANNSLVGLARMPLTIIFNVTDSVTDVLGTTSTVTGGNLVSNTKTAEGPGFEVWQGVWNLAGAADGYYQFNVSSHDTLGHVATSYLNISYDGTPPTISLNNFANTAQLNGKYYTVAGETVTLSTTQTDSFSGVNSTIITVKNMDNQTVNTCIGTTATACAYTPNKTGVYTFTVVTNDSASNVNYTLYQLYVINGKPMVSYDASKFTVESEALNLKRSSYSLPVPIYKDNDEALGTGGFFANPIYTDKPLFAGATSLENMAYNYTFNLNATNLSAANEVVTVTIKAMGLVPGQMRTMVENTPEGPVTLNLIAPVESQTAPGDLNFQDLFTIYYNGTQYNNTGAGQPVTGTFSFEGTGVTTVVLTMNATNNTVTPVTLFFNSIPPVNVTTQTVTGFDPTTAPPQLGATLNTTYFLNLSAINQFYTQDDVKLEFVFPKNVTVKTGNATITYNTSSNLTLEKYNGTAWVDATGDAAASAYSHCFNVTDNITDSDLNGANITVCFAGWTYKITKTVNDHSDIPTAWIKGKALAMMSNVTLTFPTLAETVPSGSTGDNAYTASINMAQKGNIKIPTDKVPGIVNADHVTVYVDGAAWQGSYKIGSITLLDGTIEPGAHDIKVAYHVPSKSTTSTTGGYVSGPVPSGSASSKEETSPVTSYESTDEVVTEVTSNKELRSAMEKVLGEELTGDVLGRIAEQSYEHAKEFTHTASMTSSTSASTLHVKIEYTGTKTLYNVMIYDPVPKDLAATASEITVNAPGATVRVVKPDPVFLLSYDQVNPGDKLTIDYQTQGWKDLNIAKEKNASEVFVAGKAPEEKPAPAPEEEKPAPKEEEKPAEEKPAAPPAPAPAEKPAEKPAEVTPTAQDYTWVIAAAVIAVIAVIAAALMYMRQGAGKTRRRR